MSNTNLEIVISGISGQYPLSGDIETLKENLFAGVDMITADDTRWPVGFQRLPARTGKVYGMNLFDNKFFGLTDEEADYIDPQERLLMEEVYKAILDAGVDPESLRDTNTGYFNGGCVVETHQDFLAAETIPEGIIRSVVTRIPKFLGLRGPVLVIDTACASGLSALVEAYHSIQTGICDQAIVTASSTLFRPIIAFQFHDMNMTNQDGRCKCLDANGNGYCRSEAVVAIFLQKSQDAKRIYCYLHGGETNHDGYKVEGITFPSTKGQAELLTNTYQKADIISSDIDYIEAHVTGTKAGDPVETAAIYEVICTQKSDPLKVGCLKSNIGHTEACSGLCAISKAVIIHQSRLIPPNIHYNTPNPAIKGLLDGKLLPVVTTTPFTGHYIPVNCFGFGGSNTHVVTADVPSYQRTENSSRTQCDYNIFLDDVPVRLVNICGRTHESIEFIYSSLKKKSMYRNREFLSLLDSFSKSNPINFPFRGFLIMSKDDNGELSFRTATPTQVTKNQAITELSLILEFGAPDLATSSAFDKLKLSLPTFKEMESVLDMVTPILESNPSKKIIAKSVAFQLSVVKLFRELSVPIHRVVGYSTGELACAYQCGIISDKVALSAAYLVLDRKAGPFLVNNMNTSILSTETNWTSWKGVSPEDMSQRLSQLSPTFESSSPDMNSLIVRVDHRLSINGQVVKELGEDSVGTASYVLYCLGRLYSKGIKVASDSPKLVPPVSYPLSPATPFLSPLIKWDHKVPKSLKPFLHDTSSTVGLQKTKNITYRFDQINPDDAFLFDHKIDGRSLFPATGYLMLVWSTLAKLNRTVTTEFPVRFDRVKFLRAVVLSPDSEAILSVRIDESTGSFEIKEADVLIVSGRIASIDPNATVGQILNTDNTDRKNSSDSAIVISSEDVYKELKIRGYDYGSYFQGIKEAYSNGSSGKVIWREVITREVRDTLNFETEEDNANLWNRSWCIFTDSMLQLQLLRTSTDSRCLFVPTSIDSLTIIPEEIKASLSGNTFTDPMTQLDASLLTVYQDTEASMLYTSGIVMKGFRGTLLQRKKQAVQLMSYDFIPLSIEGGCIDDPEVEVLLGEYVRALVKRTPGNFDLKDERFSVLSMISEKENDVSDKEEDSQDHQDSYIKCDRDILLGGINNGFILHQQKFFKSAIDMVTYNLITSSNRTSIDVLEVNLSPSSMSSIVAERINEYVSDPYVATCRLMTLSGDLSDEVKGAYKDVIVVDESLLKDESKSKMPSTHLVVVNVSSEEENLLPLMIERTSQGVKEGGFMMFLYRTPFDQEIENLTESSRTFSVEENYITKLTSSLKSFTHILTRKLSHVLPYKMVLLRKDHSSSHSVENVVIEVGINNIVSWFDILKEHLSSETPKRVWITADPRDKLFKEKISGILGFAKSLRQELNGDRIRVLLDYSTCKSIDLLSPEYEEVVKRDLAYNIRFCNRDGWGSIEHFSLPDNIEGDKGLIEETEHFYLRILRPGDLSTLTWVKNVVPSNRQFLENHVRVFYSALNFKDILFATGRLPMSAIPQYISPLEAQDSLLGLEYSGIDQNGNRVMGILPYKALASSIPITDRERDFMWSVPQSWTLEEAATVPVVYATVIYALLVRGKITRGESILIHAGAGGVGLAAIHVSLYFGCQVYTTVGSEEKKRFLLDYFKGRVKEEHVFNSRNTTFEDKVMEMTDGEGVDVILNSLSDDKFDSTLRLLHECGRFLEIGKVDMINGKSLKLSSSLNVNQSFHGIFLDTLTQYSDDDYFSKHVLSEKSLIKKYMREGIEAGFIQPLPRVKYGLDKVEDAFRFMASGKHVGKVLIEVRKETYVAPKQLSMESIKSTFMSPDKSYIVLGGLGGLGLEVVQWLVTKGARHILINSRRGITNNYQQMVCSRLKKEKVNVVISQTDSTTRSGVMQLIESARKMASLGVGGIFNSVLVLKDCLFSEQTVEIFEQVSSTKCNTTIYLDELSRVSCPNLDYFVTFSSFSGGRGNAGQSNYNFGNSVMDSVCMSRVEQGLPGLSIQWGVIGDVGFVADLLTHRKSNGSSGRGHSGSEVVVAGSAAQRIHSVLETLDRVLKYRSIGCVSSTVKPSNEQGGKEGMTDLLKIISNIIGLNDITQMDPNSVLGAFGIDSLMAVEMKQTVERTTQGEVNLEVKEIRNLTILDIKNIATGIRRSDSGSVATA